MLSLKALGNEMRSFHSNLWPAGRQNVDGLSLEDYSSVLYIQDCDKDMVQHMATQQRTHTHTHTHMQHVQMQPTQICNP